MREIVSMKETTIAFVTFFVLFYLVIQVRIIRKLRKIKKNTDNFSEEFIILEAFDAICGIIECCGTGCGEGLDAAAQAEKRAKEYKKLDPKTEKSRTMELMRGKEKASIWWLSFTASLPKERIIQIFTEDPNFIIMNGYVYTKELMSKDELAKLSESLDNEEIKG
jgi:hypothetical protein